MTWETVKAADIRIGDRVRTSSSPELTVMRIDVGFFGRDDLIAFVEDSDDQWLKAPALLDADVEVLRG